MGRALIPTQLLRRAGLGVGLGALAGMVSAQPAPPVAPVAAEAPVVPAPKSETSPPPAPPPSSVAETRQTPAVVPARPQVVAKPAEVVTRRNRYDIAVLQALDKVTAETLRFEARVNVPVRWKGLIFTVRTCERSAPEEAIDDAIAYLTIDAQPRPQPGRLTPPPKQAFKGWMYAASPGLNPVQHATYDAWVISCRTSAPPVVAAAPRPPAARPPAAAESKPPETPPAAPVVKVEPPPPTPPPEPATKPPPP